MPSDAAGGARVRDLALFVVSAALDAGEAGNFWPWGTWDVSSMSGRVGGRRSRSDVVVEDQQILIDLLDLRANQQRAALRSSARARERASSSGGARSPRHGARPGHDVRRWSRGPAPCSWLSEGSPQERDEYPATAQSCRTISSLSGCFGHRSTNPISPHRRIGVPIPRSIRAEERARSSAPCMRGTVEAPNLGSTRDGRRSCPHRAGRAIHLRPASRSSEHLLEGSTDEVAERPRHRVHQGRGPIQQWDPPPPSPHAPVCSGPSLPGHHALRLHLAVRSGARAQ